MILASILISEVQYSNLPPWIQVIRVSYFPQFVFIFIDVCVSLWCWTRRKEAWGIAMGIGVIQITLPLLLWNPVMIAIVFLITASEILLLLTPNVRNEFIEKSRLHHREQREQARTHHPIFWIVLLMQTIKSTLTTVGGVLLLQTYGFFEPYGHDSVFWIINIPHVPLALLMGGTGFVASAGLYSRKKWSYDSALALAVMGIIEASFVSLIIIFYISVGIVVLMLTHEAKTSFDQPK